MDLKETINGSLTRLEDAIGENLKNKGKCYEKLV